MILVEGSAADLHQVRVKIHGKSVFLTPESDPKLLFRVVRELALWILRNRKS